MLEEARSAEEQALKLESGRLIISVLELKSVLVYWNRM